MPIKAVVFDAYGTLFDVQSVAGVTEDAFPGRGETITQIWRLKQLEYTWLRALMGRYEDFWSVTQASLDFTLKTLGLEATPDLLARIAAAYDALALYPEALAALQGLAPTRLAIFSNGSPAMLTNLTRQAGIDALLTPTTQTPAVRVDAVDQTTTPAHFTRLGNLLELCALAVPDGDAIAGRLNDLASSGEFDLVVATRDWHPPDHGSFAEQGGPWPVHCVAGTPGAELHHALDPTPIDLVVDKGQDPSTEGYSGFEETNLEKVLRDHDVDELTVVGLATDYCVKETAADALRHGFRVTVDREGIRGIDVGPGDSERALDELRAAGAEVT